MDTQDKQQRDIEGEQAKLWLTIVIQECSGTILGEVENVIDQALHAELDFARIQSILVAVDALNLSTTSALPKIFWAPLFLPLSMRYSALLRRSRDIAARNVAYAERYLGTVLPIVKDAKVDVDGKKKVLQQLLNSLKTIEQDAESLKADFESLLVDLANFGRAMDEYAKAQRIELQIKLAKVQMELARLIDELTKTYKEMGDNMPSVENSSKPLLGLGGLATAAAASAALGPTAATMATALTGALAGGKTLAAAVGTLSAAGSAGAVAAVTVAAPVAMIVLAGWGIWAAVKSAQVIAAMAHASVITAQIIAKQAELVMLLRDSMTLAAAQTLSRVAISEIMRTSVKITNLVDVCSIVSGDASALMQLLEQGASVTQIEESVALADTWYNLLIEMLKSLSTKLLPRVEVSPVDVQKELVEKIKALVSHFACQGGTSQFMPQCHPMPPAAGIEGVALDMPTFERDFMDALSGTDALSMTRDEADMMETLNGMHYPEPYVVDIDTEMVVGDLGEVGVITYGRMAGAFGRLAKLGFVNRGYNQARTLVNTYGPRVSQWASTTDNTAQTNFRNMALHAYFEIPPPIPNPEHETQATQANIVWLLMWRREVTRWLVTQLILTPTFGWFSEIWLNQVTRDHALEKFAEAIDTIVNAFDKWRESREPPRDGDKKGPMQSNMMFLSVAPQVSNVASVAAAEEQPSFDDTRYKQFASASPPFTDAGDKASQDWQSPLLAEISQWSTPNLQDLTKAWVTGEICDETAFWDDYGKNVVEDGLDLIGQIYRLNLLQLLVLTGKTKLSVSQPIFAELVKNMQAVFSNALRETGDQLTAQVSLYFYAARCTGFCRPILALALQSVLISHFKA
ncbi:hypothetical protein B0H13DRAFT_2678696 [Mycena leptocephala]|nr:hypothetical protein B0H13DRAFT_2678696 [Mycena leptocephala]